MGRKKGRAVKRARKSQTGGTEEDYKKAPHSFVFNRGHVGKNVKILMRDVRHVMEPYTASNLQVKRKNALKDFVGIAGALNVSHLLMFTKTEVATNLRIARLPRGPTLTFKVHEYCLSKDVISALRKPNLEQKQFLHHPLLVMNNFSGNEMSLKLMSTMFQNMFPSINVNKVNLNNLRRCILLNYSPESKHIEFRHYNVKVVPVGVSRGVKKLIKATVPDMGKFYDVSDYIVKGGNLSESEAELDDPQGEVVLPQQLSSRGNIKQAKSAIRLTEIGPRMTLQLVKIEEGVCEGEVMFHEFIHKTEDELKNLKAFREKKRKLKEIRKQKQAQNIEKKKKEKEEHKQKSIQGMKDKVKEKKEDSNDESSDDDVAEDIEYYKQEVGAEPEPELFPTTGSKRKRSFSSKRNAPNFKKRKTRRRENDSVLAKQKNNKKGGDTGNIKKGAAKKKFSGKKTLSKQSRLKAKRGT